MARKASKAPDAPPPQLRGKVVVEELSKVKPNKWNPNRMDDDLRMSLRYGLQTDGWLVSQALLVWGTDEKGKRRNVIIDGEHRWTEANALGMAKGPMVFLDDLPEAQAKALTIKLNNKRGDFVEELLRPLLTDIQFDLGDNLALDLGFNDDQLLAMLSTEPLDLDEVDSPRPSTTNGNGQMPSNSEHVRQVQLFFTTKQKERWDAAINKLARHHKTENVSDTALAVALAAAKSLKG